MTDRIHSITLTLDHDIRDDDIQPLIDACMQFRNVIDVHPNVSDIALHVAEQRARMRIATEMHEAFRKIAG